MNKYVFKYSYHVTTQDFVLEKAYKLLGETENHVLVRHWYGKRWHPKNSSWRIEE